MHVMAVVWKLDEMSRNNEMKNQCENDVPCMSLPRKWGIPGSRTMEHEPIMALTAYQAKASLQTRQVIRGGKCCLIFMIPVL